MRRLSDGALDGLLIALVFAAFVALAAWAVVAGRSASAAACEQEAARLGLPHWTLGERSVCLGSWDGQQWVVLRPGGR